VAKTPNTNLRLALTIYRKGLRSRQLRNGTSQFGRWFEHKWGKPSGKERIWKKIHITTGVRTNIISAVNITQSNRNDSPELPNLINDTKKLYNIREVSADKAYLSKENLNHIHQLGAIPFIPFKTNTNKKRNTLSIWGKMYKFFINHPEEFAYHYHKRSNVETTFHMIKTKFGSHLRSKTSKGQENEILAKCLCHNICVLIQETFELKIPIDFQKCAKLQPAQK